MNLENHNILFFDGECNLCNKLIDFLFRIDKKKNLRFASLQGNTAKRILPKELLLEHDSLVFFQKEKLFMRSSASLRAFREIGGLFTILYIFILVPPVLRDWIYDKVAANRYRWFGKRLECRVPKPDEKYRFLD